MRIVVAIAGPGGFAPKTASRLKQKLVQRRLGVQLLKRKEEKVSPETDVVLLSCSNEDVNGLAQWIESEWNEQWNGWFALNRKKQKGVEQA